MDYYVKADAQAEFVGALEEAGWLIDGKLRLPANVQIDVIGEIADVTPGATIKDPPQVTKHEGYHANVRSAGPLPKALAALAIDAPATPRRVWAK